MEIYNGEKTKSGKIAAKRKSKYGSSSWNNIRYGRKRFRWRSWEHQNRWWQNTDRRWRYHWSGRWNPEPRWFENHTQNDESRNNWR